MYLLVVPSGLVTAPLVFSKIQKALFQHWRAQGIRIFAYLDDGVGGHSSLQEAKLVSQMVRNDIDQSDFVWHPEKSFWDPAHCDEVLGFIVNLAEGYFRVPERRITQLNGLLHNIGSNNSRKWAILLYLEWVTRELNIEADNTSRQTHEDDYMLNPTHFAALNILWGPHTVDRFSSYKTRQIPRFCSRWLNPCRRSRCIYCELNRRKQLSFLLHFSYQK